MGEDTVPSGVTLLSEMRKKRGSPDAAENPEALTRLRDVDAASFLRDPYVPLNRFFGESLQQERNGVAGFKEKKEILRLFDRMRGKGFDNPLSGHEQAIVEAYVQLRVQAGASPRTFGLSTLPSTDPRDTENHWETRNARVALAYLHAQDTWARFDLKGQDIRQWKGAIRMNAEAFSFDELAKNILEIIEAKEEAEAHEASVGEEGLSPPNSRLVIKALLLSRYDFKASPEEQADSLYALVERRQMHETAAWILKTYKNELGANVEKIREEQAQLATGANLDELKQLLQHWAMSERIDIGIPEKPPSPKIFAAAMEFIKQENQSKPQGV